MIYFLAFIYSQIAFAGPKPPVCQSFGTFVPLEGKAEGMEYIRVHPTGNYVLYSTGSYGNPGVEIADLTETASGTGQIKPRIISTPLYNEAYPCEGSWTLISSCQEANGMVYYNFKDILESAEKAKPVFNDKDHDQYYQSCAEFPGSTPEQLRFRMLLYGKSSRIYTLNKGQPSAVFGPKKDICSNIGIEESVSQPILSKDGTEVAAYFDGSQRVFRINDNNGTCREVENLKYPTGKVSFSYRTLSDPGMIAFSTPDTIGVSGELKPSESLGNKIYVFDRGTKRTYRISQPWLDESAFYPGFTRDGRVIYATKRNGKNGIVIVDVKSAIVQLRLAGSMDIDAICSQQDSAPNRPPRSPGRGRQ